MDLLLSPYHLLIDKIVPFLVMLSVIVFIHELGHFLVARWCGVKIEVFSIGFGKEIFGRDDKHGTRWKLCWVPLGGYVKFEGDMNAASMPDHSKPVTPSSFMSKPLWQKTAVVSAGPIANFILAILLFTVLMMSVGEIQIPPRVDGVLPDSAAQAAGLQPGDLVVEIDGSPISTFQDLQRTIIYGGGAPVTLKVQRKGSLLEFGLTPKIKEESDGYGGSMRIGLLGVKHDGTKDELVYRRYGLVDAFSKGCQNTWFIVSTTVKFIGKLFTGAESVKQLSGPGMMGAGAGAAAQSGLSTFLSYMAFISVSIGLVNLFPVPVLDGGHLVFYALEAIRGKPLGPNASEWAARIGVSFVLLMMFIGTYNDIVRWLVVHGFGS
jgi:regulator of sigma E protease